VVRTSLHYLGGGTRSFCLLQRLGLKHQVKGMLRRLETLTLFLRAFLALWRWVVALVAFQGPALYLERIAATS
jgi:hypothetical protein